MSEPQRVVGAGEPTPLGATIVADGVNFAVRSHTATAIWVSLFDERDRETAMLPLESGGDGVFSGLVAGIGAGARYGLRADGPWAPAEGHFFDPAKLLVDPFAKRLDRRFRADARLNLPREAETDTAPAVPKAFVVAPDPAAPRPRPGAPFLIYELHVRGQTMLHPGVSSRLRGTVAALSEPAVLDHLTRIGVDTVELMPVAAWIDDRHLHGLGLTNFWGYNPVALMAPDPGLAPGGLDDIRALTEAYATAGLSVVLDVVFNHTGEGDADGPILSMRGLDNRSYYRHAETDRGLELVNDTGCGNTVACDHPIVVELAMAAMRHWVEAAGVAGFRFDLAPVMGRRPDGFDADAPLLAAMRDDPVLSEAVLIAEPWDVGPGGYQLGQFGAPFLEWNDAYRDDVRRFWRGDEGVAGDFATRLAGSSDIFSGGERDAGASVNFVSAHDGFTLADLVSYTGKNNVANLEGNRDGHDHNFSWNNGIEGETTDPEIRARRRADIKALLATLMLARGTPMIGAGDELGETQQGNNNAYAQDNPISWIEWQKADDGLIAFTAELAGLRRRHPVLTGRAFLSGAPDARGVRDCVWLKPDGGEMDDGAWQAADLVALGMWLTSADDSVLIWFNRGREAVPVSLPGAARGFRPVLASFPLEETAEGRAVLAPRSVVVFARHGQPEGAA